MRVASLAGGLAALLLAVPSAAEAQVPADSAKRVAVRNFLRLMRTDSNLIAGLDMALAEETPDPSLPAGFLDSVRARARRSTDRFIDLLVPIYDSLFTMAELQELTRMFSSPTGQRYVAAQSTIAVSAAEIGRRWGMALAGEVMLDLSRQPRRP